MRYGWEYSSGKICIYKDDKRMELPNGYNQTVLFTLEKGFNISSADSLPALVNYLFELTNEQLELTLLTSKITLMENK